MHTEIVSDVPGKCPKCGMDLVLKEKVKTIIHTGEDKGLGVITWRSYIPLLVIVSLIILVSLTRTIVSGSNLNNFILNFMTGFFLVFGGFKLMDLKGFAHGYADYDLLARKWSGYGFIYPFIELGFGFLMLAGYHSASLLIVELVVMVFSGIGVAIKISKREPFLCACLGTFLKVPLTYVTLIEDFGMALLALLLLLNI